MRLLKTKKKKVWHSVCNGDYDYKEKENVYIVEMTEKEYFESQNRIILSRQDYGKLMDMLHNPREPTDALKELMKDSDLAKEFRGDLDKLEKYRELFRTISKQPDKTLEYTTDELTHYYCQIEEIDEKKFKPFFVYRDPSPEDIYKNINLEAFKDYQFKAGTYTVKLDENGKIANITITEKETK